MIPADYLASYRATLNHLIATEGEERAMDLIVGGRIVFSYLDFAVGSHWAIFEQSLANRGPHRVLNKFIGKDAIRAWAAHLGLRVERLYDGPEPWIQHANPIIYADGRIAPNPAEFGQSIAVLVKS